MKIYRERFSLNSPWEMAVSDLNAVFGEPKQAGDEYRWHAAAKGPYRLSLIADRSAGRIDAVVSTVVPYKFLTTFLILGIAWTIATSARVLIAVALSVVCLALVGFALAPLFLFFNAAETNIPVEGQLVSKHTSRFFLVPFIGFFILSYYMNPAMWGPYFVVIFVLGLVALGFQLNLFGTSLRRQPYLVLIPGFAGLPGVHAFGNLLMLDDVGASLPDRWLPLLILTSVISTVIFLVLYAWVGQLIIQHLADFPNEPIASKPIRWFWSGLLLVLNTTLVLSVILVTMGVVLGKSWLPLVSLPIFRLAAGFETWGLAFPQVLAKVSIGVISLPVLLVLILWIYYLTNTVRDQRKLIEDSSPIDRFDDSTAIRAIDSRIPTAIVLRRFHGKPFIILSTALLNELDDEQIEAVIAHERYHLEHGDHIRTRIASLFGLLIGGRNALVAFYDFPELERRADEHAAETVGVEPLVTALRRIEQATPTATGFGTPAIGATNSNPFMVSLAGISAIYQILFGSFLLETAHPSIDTRIERVLNG